MNGLILAGLWCLGMFFPVMIAYAAFTSQDNGRPSSFEQ